MDNIKLNITPHAIDRASQRCLDLWLDTRDNYEEGLYTWLHKNALQCSKLMQPSTKEKIKMSYRGLSFVFKWGHKDKHTILLLTVMKAY
jgi:hypothetical protein